MFCPGCKTQDAIRIKVKYDSNLNTLPYSCDKCQNIKLSKEHSYRDADGNEISLPSYMYGRYSYAIGGVISSKQQYSEVLKANGLIQKGTEHQR